MKINKFILYTGLVFTTLYSACHSGSPDIDTRPGGSGSTSSINENAVYHTLKEDFETGKKPRYTDDNVMLNSGQWRLDDAMIGDGDKDVKNGNAAARIKNGSISMNFDLDSVAEITISHAIYGADKTSAWQLLVSTDAGVSYTPVADPVMEVSDKLTTTSFKTDPSSRIRLKIIKTGKGRINIDDITFTILGSGHQPALAADSLALDTNGSNTSFIPNIIGGDAPPATGDNSNLLLGNPSGAEPTVISKTNYFIDQGYYVESYNAEKGEPNWVSWHLDASNITGAAGRKNDFSSYTGLNAGWYEVKSDSYLGSGFDRGHNCPSGDRTSSVGANSSTFLMTNMIPQAPNNNQHTWEKFESYLRLQVMAGNEIYIIMGSYGTGGIGSSARAKIKSIAGGHVNVPSNIWKVAVIIPVGNDDLNRIDLSTKVIAINTPNINSISPDWKKYRSTVRDIEKATGYDLLSALPKNVQDVIETSTSN